MRPLTVLGIMLIIAGIALIIAGSVQPIIVSTGTENVSSKGGFAGCVVIFFVPICFSSSVGGTSWVPVILVLFVVVFLALIIFFFYVMMKSMKAVSYAVLQ